MVDQIHRSPTSTKVDGNRQKNVVNAITDQAIRKEKERAESQLQKERKDHHCQTRARVKESQKRVKINFQGNNG